MKSVARVLAVFCAGLCGLPPCSAQSPQIVQTDGGAVSGIPGSNPAIAVYKGIPYAAPPVGNLRWKPPVTPAKWTGVLKADHYGASCMQRARATVGRQNSLSEDCLYLNVWTPAKSPDGSFQ